jgi:septum formation protein
LSKKSLKYSSFYNIRVTNMRLILASSSAYRQSLLQRLSVPFVAIAPAVDETPLPEEDPVNLARRLAQAKAEVIASRETGAIVIASDQVACLGETLLGKPGSQPVARAQLLASSGNIVRFYTSLCVLTATGTSHTALAETEVHFRRLQEREIDRYLQLEQPWDCAGSFKCEGLGISLFEKLVGEDPTALEGLPLIALSNILRELQVHPLLQ